MAGVKAYRLCSKDAFAEKDYFAVLAAFSLTTPDRNT
jgi:hypothetical protein